jgi:excisionase family DNA binding protein
MPKAESDILTILEVASYLKIAERTVYRLAAAKKLPAFKVGGAWRFSRAEIDSWIRRQSSENSEEAGPGPHSGPA